MSSYRVIRYEPRLFEVLQTNATVPSDSLLRQRTVTDWYYTTSEYCSLMMVVDKSDRCLACLGKELLSLKTDEQVQEVGCLSGFYAFHNGYGFYAFASTLRDCAAGLMQGGTEPALRFAGGLKWHFGEIPAYCFNIHYEETKGRRLRAAGKKVLNLLKPKSPLKSLEEKLQGVLQQVRLVEQGGYPSDLLEFQSGFRFAFRPSFSHLAWRYPLDCSFVRYRCFKAFTDKGYLGYVIIEDTPDRLIAAQVDGTEPSLLAAAIIKAVSAAARDQNDAREASLLCSHTAMQRVFESVGFRAIARRNRTYGIGTMKGPLTISVPQSEWLMNYDLADRGLLGLRQNGSQAPVRVPAAGAWGTELELGGS